MKKYKQPLSEAPREPELIGSKAANMNIRTPETERHRIREALIEFGQTRERTHWVTLNTHRDISMETAHQRLKRWRVEMLRKLHGRHFFRLPESERFEFFGAPHFTAAVEPHFHLACSVPDHLTEKFERLAPKRWLAIVPSGTCHIAPVDSEPTSPRHMLGYALRVFNPRADLSFVDSRLYS